MPFRTDNGISRIQFHYLEKYGKLRGVKVHIGVEKHDVFANGILDAAGKCASLFLILLVPDYAHTLRVLKPCFGGTKMRLVGTSVIDDHDLEVISETLERFDRFDNVLLDEVRFVIRRNDDGKLAVKHAAPPAPAPAGPSPQGRPLRPARCRQKVRE